MLCTDDNVISLDILQMLWILRFRFIKMNEFILDFRFYYFYIRLIILGFVTLSLPLIQGSLFTVSSSFQDLDFDVS